MESKTVVSFQDAGKRFDDNWVFRNVNLDLPTSQIVAIVGESGSGKTTLLQLINGVQRTDEGTVQVMGSPVPSSGIHSFRRGIGYAVQGGGLFPHMTVYRNVTILARLEGWETARCRSRYEELLSMMGLDHGELQDRYPYQISGGQQHRVSLCRALMLKPQILLLDEPFSAIDPMSRGDIHREFLALQEKEKVSALLVTHDLREAVALSKYLVVMANGTIVQHGATEQVLKEPEKEYVAKLLETYL